MKNIWKIALCLNWAHACPFNAQAHPGHPSNDIEILISPQPKFPQLALWLGLAGHCEVDFSLYQYGRILQIEAVRCTSRLFCRSAFDALTESRMRVVDVAGTATPGDRRNIVFPLDYVFDAAEPAPDTPFFACGSTPTA